MKVVSLFSGAGGLDLGFKMAGHDIIWANDLYGDAVETYRLNLGNHIVCEDIFKVNVGVRNDIDFEYIFPRATHSKDGKDGLPKWVSVSEAMAPIPDPDSPNNLLNHEYSKYKLNFNGYLGHRQLDPDKPAPTVTARGDNKGGVVILPILTENGECRAENLRQFRVSR